MCGPRLGFNHLLTMCYVKMKLWAAQDKSRKLSYIIVSTALALSGLLNRDWRYYSCEWPHIARLPPEGSLSCDTPLTFVWGPRFVTFCPKSGPYTMGPKMITQDIFKYLGINFSITQDICYTGLSGRNYFVQFGAFIRYFMRTRQLHTLIVWELIFRVTLHICYTRE